MIPKRHVHVCWSSRHPLTNEERRGGEGTLDGRKRSVGKRREERWEGNGRERESKEVDGMWSE